MSKFGKRYSVKSKRLRLSSSKRNKKTYNIQPAIAARLAKAAERKLQLQAEAFAEEERIRIHKEQLMMKAAARREATKAQKALINKDPLALDGEPMIDVPSGSGCVVIKQEPIAEIYLDPLSIDQLEEPSAEGSMDPLAIGDLGSWAPSANGGEFSRSDAVPLELEEDDLIYFKSLAPDLAHLTPELKEVFRIKVRNILKELSIR